MHNNQRGFAIIEMILLLLIAAIIGATGYYVWHANRQTRATLDAASKSANSEVPKKYDEAGWLIYKAPSGHYQIDIPNGWKLIRYARDDFLYAPTPSDIASSTAKASVTQTNEGKDFEWLPLFIAYGKARDYNRHPEAVKQTSFPTVQGLTVDKYYYKQVDPPVTEGIGQLPEGGEEYRYEVTYNQQVFIVTHNIVPTSVDKSSTDQTTLIEQMLTTLILY